MSPAKSEGKSRMLGYDVTSIKLEHEPLSEALV